MRLADIDVVILVGGLGTRINHLLKDTPKPMVPVCGKPFLEWILLFLIKNGFRRIIFSTGYLADKISSYFGDGTKWNISISYVEEETPLDTGGATKYCLSKVKSDPFFVLNGDTLTLLDYKGMLDYFLQKNADISLAITKVDKAQRYGVVLFDESGRVNSFKEKFYLPKGGWINAGVYLMKKNIFEGSKLNGKFSLENELLPLVLNKNIFAFPVEAGFIDIGTPQSLKKSKLFLNSQKGRF